MVSNDRKFRNRTFFHSFKVAIEGIILVSREEKNFRFHLFSAVIVTLLGFIFSISKVEWLFVCTAIFGMLAFELLNSAIERVVDLATDQFHPLAKAAKDMASGAVLLFSFYSLVVGIIIFFPELYRVFSIFIGSLLHSN